MPSQILQIKPDLELTFRGPFDKVVTSGLKLRNPSSDVVAFKVKTTAPKRYCVRPNSGLVQPNSEVEVSVMLQPFDYDPADKARHKFMVQSLVVKAAAAAAVTADGGEKLWNSATPFDMMNSRLSVIILPAAVADYTGVSVATETAAAAAARKNSAGEPGPAELPPEKLAPPLLQLLPRPDDQRLPRLQQKLQPEQLVDSEDNANESNSELRRLQKELRRLQQENARLCEQELTLRKATMREAQRRGRVGGQQAEAAAAAASPQAQTVASICSLMLVIAFGVIVGKMLLQ